MDICDVCGRTIAEFLCLCSSPFLRICSSCAGLHVTKPSQTSHSLEPIACKLFLTGTGSIPRYQARQSTIRQANEALDQNLKQIEAYKCTIQSLVDTVNTWTAERLRQIERVEAQIRDDIAACKEKNKELMATSEVPVDSKLVEVIFGSDGGKLASELTIFHCRIVEETAVSSMLEGLFHYQVSPSPLILPPSTPSQAEQSSTGTMKARKSQQDPPAAKKESETSEKSQYIAVLQRHISNFQAELQLVSESKTLIPVQTLPESGKASQEVHEHIFCDGCQQTPLLGPRWQCKSCPSFDFCQNCLNTKAHPHPFQRIILPQ